MLEVRRIDRADLTALLDTDACRKGNMLEVSWPRLHDKRRRNEAGEMETVEAAGTLITRRLVLRKPEAWASPTPSGNYQPKGGIMFNVATQAQATAIRNVHTLYLFMALEGKSHPWGEADHPVNVPLDRVSEIYNTATRIFYLIED